MDKCLNCGGEIVKRYPNENRKFCGRSCSVSYNNRINPKRKPEHSCFRCGRPASRRRLCSTCKEDDKIAWDNQTLADIRGDSNANGSRYPYIRQRSRRVYVNSGKPLSCSICGYSVHVDIAHIVAISSFPEDTLLSVVNSVDNLIALCKNHHWEYDNGFLILA